MADSLLGLTFQINYLFNYLTITNVIDMILVAMIFFVVFQALYQTRSLQLLRGVVVAAILGGGLLVLLPLDALNWMVRYALLAGVIALPILFQDELRRVLVRLGRIGQQKGMVNNFERFRGSLISAVNQLSQRNIGALIVLEGQTLLEDIAETGIRLGAEVISPELLLTIFSPKTPLHDGAVLLRGDRMIAASCLLPLQTEDLGNSQLGTRHRAALGLSTKAPEALVIVVSEETGWISVAFAGQLHLHLSLAELEGWINQFADQLVRPVSWRWKWLAGGGFRSSLYNLIISLILALIVWLIVVYQTNPPSQTTIQGIPLSVVGLPDYLLVNGDLPDSINAQVQSTGDRIKALSATSAQAVVDVTGLSEGIHSIPVKVTFGDPFVQTLSIKPKSIDVKLERILNKPVTPTVTINDLAALPYGYVVDQIEFTPDHIHLSGAESQVAKVAAANLDLTIGGRLGGFQETGEPTLIDRNGNRIQGVTQEPDKVVVTVTIRKIIFTEEFGIHAQVDEAGIDPGYEVTAVHVEPPKITVAGPQKALERVDGYIETAVVPLRGHRTNFSTSVPLIVPNGMTAMDEKGKPVRSVEIQVEIAPINGYLVIEREVQITNLKGLIEVTIQPNRISLLLIGPQFLLSEIKKNPQLVIASVDMEDETSSSGFYPIHVQAPGGVQVQMFPNEVQLIYK